MNDILLISIKTLKEDYLLDQSLDDKFILSNIRKCQDFIILPVLGISKMEELTLQIKQGSLSGDNKELIENYIHPVMGYWIMSESILTLSYKFKNNPEPTALSQLEQLMRLSTHYFQDHQKYLGILRERIGGESKYQTGLYLY